MNAISQPLKLLDSDVAVNAIVSACHPILRKYGEVPYQGRSDEYWADVRNALSVIGLPIAPAPALAAYEYLRSVRETHSSSKDDCPIFLSTQIALDFLRWQVGYEGNVSNESDVIARIKILIMEIEEESLEREFMIAALGELWGDIRGFYKELHEFRRGD